MENAVKALLIAAAVLIAVLIIAMVMGVFNMGAEQVENAGDLSEYQIQEHNGKFTNYEGESVTGTDVNALLTTVFNHNNAQPDVNTCVEVTGLAKIAKSNAITTSPTKVSAGARYKVVATYDAKTRLINKITISAATK